MTKFSVLIANYNNSSFIQTSISSILTQSFQDFEVIIVDDCSSDNSLNIIDSMMQTDSRIKLFTNKYNRGVGYTKRKCIDLCNGDLFAFLDSDDALAPNALQIMVDAHLLWPNASIIYSTHYICSKDLNIISISKKCGSIPPIKTYLNVTASDDFHISHFASFKKQYYILTEGLNSSFKKAADKDLYFKMEEVGELVYLNIPLYFYRQHSNSISLNDNSIDAYRWEIKAKEMAFKRRKRRLIAKNITKEDLLDLKYNYYLLLLESVIKRKNYFKFFLFSLLFVLNYPKLDSIKIIYSFFFKFKNVKNISCNTLF